MWIVHKQTLFLLPVGWLWAATVASAHLQCAAPLTRSPLCLSVWTPAQAGLHVVSSAELPPSWGFKEGSLPLLGASPDAIICHMLRLDDAGADEQLAEAVQQLLLVQQEQQGQQQGQELQAQQQAVLAASQLLTELLARVPCLTASDTTIDEREAAEAASSSGGGRGLDTAASAASGGPAVKVEPGVGDGAGDEPGAEGIEAQELLEALQAAMQQLGLNATPGSRNSDGTSSACTNCSTNGSGGPSGGEPEGCGAAAGPTSSQRSVEPQSGMGEGVEAADAASLYSALACGQPLEGGLCSRRLRGAGWLCVREVVEVKNTCCFQVSFMSVGAGNRGSADEAECKCLVSGTLDACQKRSNADTTPALRTPPSRTACPHHRRRSSGAPNVVRRASALCSKTTDLARAWRRCGCHSCSCTWRPPAAAQRCC